MKNKKFASFLAAAAALVLLAMPAFAADEQTELPAAEAAEVQQEQTAAPAEQETALPADAQTARSSLPPYFHETPPRRSRLPSFLPRAYLT